MDFVGLRKITLLAVRVKSRVLCYADDTLVLVHDEVDLSRLFTCMDLFFRASNAKFNYSKAEAFSLSGLNTWSFSHHR